MSTRLTVVFDACVLYPAPLRDVLMHLAMTGMFRAKWTEMIHDEWMRSVMRQRPDMRLSRLRRTRMLMDAHALDSLVTGFESLIDRIPLPDPDDRHVVAAAIRARAHAIITFNLGDFPSTTLSPLGLAAWHPDAFVTRLLRADSRRVLEAMSHHRAALRRPPLSPGDYIAMLRRQGLQATADLIEGDTRLVLSPGSQARRITHRTARADGARARSPASRRTRRAPSRSRWRARAACARA